MASESYSGADAKHDLEEERREERRQNLKELVDDQEVRIKRADKRIEELEDLLEEAKEAKSTEVKSMYELEGITVEDFEDVEDIELPRDDEDAVTVDDLDGGENPFGVNPFTIEFKK